MVRGVGALHRAPARTSGAGVGGDGNARRSAPEPGVDARPPLRAIQPPASGAPRWPVPTPRKGAGVRPGKAPERASTSLAPTKVVRRPAMRSGFTATRASSAEEPRYKIREAISFWEENRSNVQSVSSTLQQQSDSHAPVKMEDCSDEGFMRNSEDMLKLQLELDILGTILVEEKTTHAEVEERTVALGDELKASKSVIEALESQLIISINESAELKKNNGQSLELLKNRDMEISKLNRELDILRRQEYLANEEPKMQTLKCYNAQDSPLSTKLKRMQATLEKPCNLNTRYQWDQVPNNPAEQENNEVHCQTEIKNIISLAKELSSLQQQLDASNRKELLTKQSLDELQLENDQLNDRLLEVMTENERFSSVIEELRTHNSLLQSQLVRSDELAKALSFDLRMLQESTSVVKDKADELIKVKTATISLEQELAYKCLELDDAVSDRQQLKAQILKINEKAASLEEELAKKFDELNIVSMENAELKSQLKKIESISCTMEEELAYKSKITGRLEGNLIELRSFVHERNTYFESLQNELFKLSDEKQSYEAQILIFQKKLKMTQALTTESEAIAIEAQQIAEERKAYAEEKDKEVKLLERSIEDLEITVCELEGKVGIIKVEAEHQRMQREELELQLQNIRRQTSAVPSSENASSSLENGMVDLADSTRHSQDIQNELLGAQDVSENEPEVLWAVQEGTTSSMVRHKRYLGMTPTFEVLMQGANASDVEYCADACSSGDVSKGDTNVSFPDSPALPKSTSRRKPNPYPTMEATEPPFVAVEPAPLTDDPEEPSVESSLYEGLQEPKQKDVQMEQAHSSDEGYRPEISEFEQTSPNEHLEQYSASGQPDLNGFDMDGDPSQSESRSEDRLPPPAVEKVVEIVEENELPPCAPVWPNDPVNYMRAPSDELKRLRNRNHYEGQRTATDRRFWSIEQQDLYSSIYSRAKLADMKWIDWKHIDGIENFAGIRKQCVHLGLEQIMSYCCHWDNELIRQFYSTVHISADKTSMTWMADGRKITTNKRAWEERFDIPCCAHTDIHAQLFLNDDDKKILYSAAEYTLGQINGLSPLASIANKILRTTIYPRFGSTTHNWNVLYHVVEQHPFDIIALIFGEIDLLISDHSRTKDPLLYAPYIMGMIMRAFEYEGPRESRHHSYKPRPHYKLKLSKRSHPPAAAAAPLEPILSAFHLEAAVAGHEAHVEAVDNHHQFEAARHQPQVEAVQGRAVLVQPITRTDLIQVVENKLRPIGDTVATMGGSIGRVEDGASVPVQHINISSSSQIRARSSSLAPPLQATASATLPQAPAAASIPSEQPGAVPADNPGVSSQPVRMRPSPFVGFRWYQKK